MSLQNFVVLEPEIWKWLVISDPRVINKEVIDKLDGRRKGLQTRRWTVTREDRQLVNKTFDVSSINLDRQMMALYNLKALDTKELGIQKHGSGFASKYTLDTRPIQG